MIDSDRYCNIYRRPGVDDFLDALFGRGHAVAIWTHGDQDWAASVVNFLLDKSGRRRNWAFVWSADRGVFDASSYASDPGECYYLDHHVKLKPLNKVWRGSGRRALGFTRARTLIIEDTPRNCSRNYSNAIYVQSYDRDAQAADDTLSRLGDYIRKLQHQLVSGGSVRDIEKRFWHLDDDTTHDGVHDAEGAGQGGTWRCCCCPSCLRSLQAYRIE